MNSLIQFFILALLSILYVFFNSDGFNYLIIFVTISIVFISITSHLVIRKESIENLKGQYIKISILFILSHSIVHFQIYIDYLLGNLKEDNWFIWQSPATVSKSIIISTSALVAYLLCYSLLKKLKAKSFSESKIKVINSKPINIAATILLALYYLSVDKSYLFGGYNNHAPGTVAIYFALLFEACISAILIIQCRNARLKNLDFNGFFRYLTYIKTPFILLSIYLFGVVISGDRGPIIYNSLAVILGYIFTTQKKPSTKNIIILIVFASFFITILGLARGYKEETSFTKKIELAITEHSESSYYPQSISPFTKELAISGRSVNIAVQSESRFYGMFMLQDLMLIFPTVKGFFIKLFDIPRMYTSSPQFLTNYSLGNYATWGIGSSSVADTYLDFGFVGVIIVFGMFGLLTRYLELSFYSNSMPTLIVMSATFSIFCFSVYIGRSTLIYSLSNVFYIYSFVLLSSLLSKKNS